MSKTGVCLLQFALALALSACGPEGQWERVVHPLNQTNTLASKVLPSGAEGEVSSHGLRGLPSMCKARAEDSRRYCVSCKVEQWSIQRCFTSTAVFNAESQCIFSHDRLKCVIAKPASAINLALKRSEEKRFFESYQLWENALRSIWQSRNDPDDLRRLETLLLLTNELAKWLTQSENLELDAKVWLSKLPTTSLAPATILTRCHRANEHLQNLRSEGDLNLLVFLREIKALLIDLEADKQFPILLDALSLEGMDAED